MKIKEKLWTCSTKMAKKRRRFTSVCPQNTKKYSPENQMAAIRVYADKNGYEIVKTYADEGKSGLNLDGRASLQQMLYDVDKLENEVSRLQKD